MVNWKKLIISLIIPLAVGFIASYFTMASVTTWYAKLSKPFFTPPNWLFGPAWTVLYIMMGISLYLVWTKIIEHKRVKNAITFFSIQLALNFFWSILFFGLKHPFIAFTEIIVLWIFILFTIIKFHRISRTSAYILIPYLLWVTFAACLNLAVVLMNS
jgi:translocator protein